MAPIRPIEQNDRLDSLIEDALKTGAVAALRFTGGALPSRSVVIVDHPQTHHGAACRATLALMDERMARSGRERVSL